MRSCCAALLCVCSGLAKRARELATMPPVLLNVDGVKPMEAVRRLGIEFDKHPEKRQRFNDMARASAVMGNRPRARESFLSGVSLRMFGTSAAGSVYARAGVNAYCAFSALLHGSEDAGWPPTVDDLVCWSHTFACVGTFCNYESECMATRAPMCVGASSGLAGYVRTACSAMGLVAPAACDPVLRRTRGAIAKRMLHSTRPVLLGLCAPSAVCTVG